VLAYSAQLMWYNSDGFRMPSAVVDEMDDGNWQAVAVMPGASSDVDVRLHEADSGVIDGFEKYAAISSWGQGHSDYVLVNYRQTSNREFDVGVVAATGAESFYSEFVRSRYLSDSPSGVYGQFELTTDELLDLHEMWLPKGPVSIVLEEISGDVNWGMTLHHAKFPYQSKDHQAYNTTIWLEGDGASEYLTAEVPEPGYYCLAVWKVESDDLPKTGAYTLRFNTITDAPPAERVVLQDGIRSIAPNPFNPQTVIHFDLAQAQRVQVTVFDLSGRGIRTLIDGSLAKGAHEVIWNGRDERGRGVASGVYFVVFESTEAREVRKVALVK